MTEIVNVICFITNKYEFIEDPKYEIYKKDAEKFLDLIKITLTCENSEITFHYLEYPLLKKNVKYIAICISNF